jgi:adenylate cyclase
VHSFWEVVQRTLPFPDSEIRGKTIVVGFLLRSDTGAAQKDAYPSPFGGPTIFGVEVHATAAANIAHGDWISRPGSVAVEATASGVAGAMLAFAALSLTPVLFSVVAAAAFVVWVVVAFAAWTSGIFIPGAFVVGVLSPVFLLSSSLYFYVVVKRSEQNIRSAFELYVSPEMVPKLGAQGRSLNQLGGEKLWLTALFTDIQDFTSIAEEMPAERVSEMLNAYFTEVVDVIFQNQGTLLKFIGDAVFALWGAPIKIPNHAEFAVKTALALCKEIDTFNASGRFPRLHTRIGIHTGPMVVGNLGSKRRLDYTAIGDAVNLASRVEGLNKYLGTTILFTDATRRDAGDSIIAVRVATVRPKGRRELANLFTTFDPPLEPSVKADWDQALVEFSERRFERASELFLATRMRDVRCEATALFYEGWCREFLLEPPAPGWVGELQFDKK